MTTVPPTKSLRRKFLTLLILLQIPLCPCHHKETPSYLLSVPLCRQFLNSQDQNWNWADSGLTQSVIQEAECEWDCLDLCIIWFAMSFKLSVISRFRSFSSSVKIFRLSDEDTLEDERVISNLPQGAKINFLSWYNASIIKSYFSNETENPCYLPGLQMANT